MAAAQGKMGRNGQPISKNQTSNNVINFYLLYVLEAQKLHTLRGQAKSYSLRENSLKGVMSAQQNFIKKFIKRLQPN